MTDDSDFARLVSLACHDLRTPLATVHGFATTLVRGGGLDNIEVEVDNVEIRLSPVTPASAPVVLGEDLRDLGAAVAVRLVRQLGGSVAVTGETVEIRLA